MKIDCAIIKDEGYVFGIQENEEFDLDRLLGLSDCYTSNTALVGGIQVCKGMYHPAKLT